MRKCENGEYERATTCLFQYGDDDAGGVVKTEMVGLVWSRSSTRVYGVSLADPTGSV
jgi:hypothetical protein